MALPLKPLVIKAAAVLLKPDEDGMPPAVKIILCAAGVMLLIVILFLSAVMEFLSPLSKLKDFIMPQLNTPKAGIMAYPVNNARISSGYGGRHIKGRPDLSLHGGIDFPVAFDTPVMAVAPGLVVRTGLSPDYGSHIMIEHVLTIEYEITRYDEEEDEEITEVVTETEILYSLYAHLHKVYVFSGQSVDERQQIATSGGDPARHFAGNTTGPHLHLELRRTEEYDSHFDPYPYLQNPDPWGGRKTTVRWG